MLLIYQTVISCRADELTSNTVNTKCASSWKIVVVVDLTFLDSWNHAMNYVRALWKQLCGYCGAKNKLKLSSNPHVSFTFCLAKWNVNIRNCSARNWSAICSTNNWSIVPIESELMSEITSYHPLNCLMPLHLQHHHHHENLWEIITMQSMWPMTLVQIVLNSQLVAPNAANNDGVVVTIKADIKPGAASRRQHCDSRQ